MRKSKYMRRKERERERKSAGGGASSGHAQEDFKGLGSVEQNNWKVRGIEGSAGGKGSTGMWSETQAKK